MNPLITQVLDSTSKRFDEEFTEVVRESPRIVKVPDPRIKSFLHQSNLDILAAVREIAEGMKRDNEDAPKRKDLSKTEANVWKNAKWLAFDQLITALSEGKEKV